jgi:hypothetical protein
LSTNSALMTSSKFNGVAGVDDGFVLEARDEKADDIVVADIKSSQDFFPNPKLVQRRQDRYIWL